MAIAAININLEFNFFFIGFCLLDHISHIADRLDAASRRPKLLAQCLDVHIHSPALALVLKAPYLIHNLVSGQDNPRIDHKIFQQFVFLERQLTRHIPDKYRMRCV